MTGLVGGNLPRQPQEEVPAFSFYRLTRQTIIAIEQGRYSHSLEMAFQIARVFNVPLDGVFQYPDSEGKTP